MIYLNNNTEVQEIFIPKQEITAPANPKPTYENGFEEGKKVGFNEGREYQKDQLLNLYVTENGEYEREDGWGVVTVDVPTEGSDCSEAYDKGFEDGYNQGQSECEEVDCSGAYNEGYDKGKNDGYDSGYQDGYNQGQADCPELTEITITENGRYEGAYNVVNVDVPTEGCDDAYNQGYQDGYNQGQNDCPSEGGCNLEDKWVTPSMDERDGNGLIVVNPSEGYDGMSRTVIDPSTIYNEGIEEGKNQGGDCPELTTIDITENGSYEGAFSLVNVNVPQEGGSCNLGILDLTLTDPNTVVKDASEDGYDGYNQVIVRPNNIIAQERENAINEFKNQMQEITITENGTYSIDDTELVKSIAFDGNSYFDTGIVPTENIKIEVCIKVTDGIDCGMGGIIIGGGIAPVDSQNYNGNENRGIAIGMGGGAIYGVWGAARSWNNPYECEGTTTVVLEKTDDSWTWDSEKGSFGASTLYIGGYNRNGEEVEEKFAQSIVYIKIWTDRNDDSTLITYVPNTNGNFDANGVELQRLGDGRTTYVEENVNIYPNGFKRVEVNVIPKIRNYEGVKFGHSTFTDCPFNIDEIGNYDYMFFACKNLVNPPIINAKIISAVYMFSGCESLVNGGDYDTSNATNLSGMYGGCSKLQYVGSIDCSSLPNSVVGWGREAQIFDTTRQPYLTDFGGFINLKQIVDLKGLIALNEQSVINIFNGLYDFVGNNETPNDIQGKLTMSSFITDIVEAHKSIAENKGWTITIE